MFAKRFKTNMEKSPCAEQCQMLENSRNIESRAAALSLSDFSFIPTRHLLMQSLFHSKTFRTHRNPHLVV